MLRATILVLLVALSVSAEEKPQSKHPQYVPVDRRKVARLDDKGNHLWTATFDDDVYYRSPPQLLWDEKRMYVAAELGVTALDTSNGKELWYAKGPCQRMLLSNDMLLGINLDKGNPALVACNLVNGTVVFKTSLPAGMCDAQPVREIGGAIPGPDGWIHSQGTCYPDRPKGAYSPSVGPRSP